MDSANILVVEDDADINRLLCTILEGAGYSCRAAFFRQRGPAVGGEI